MKTRFFVSFSAMEKEKKVIEDQQGDCFTAFTMTGKTISRRRDFSLQSK